jgi:hypothetical protein
MGDARLLLWWRAERGLIRFQERSGREDVKLVVKTALVRVVFILARAPPPHASSDRP